MDVFRIGLPKIEIINKTIIFDGFEFNHDTFTDVFCMPDTLSRFNCRIDRFSAEIPKELLRKAYHDLVPHQQCEIKDFNYLVNIHLGCDYFFCIISK